MHGFDAPGRTSNRPRGAPGALAAAPAFLALATLLLGCAARPQVGPEAEAVSPQGVATLIEQAERLRARRDFDAAIALYQQARERTPWNEPITASLATTYAERAAQSWNEGELRAAEGDLRAACELDPEDPVLRENLARVLLRRADGSMNAEEAEALRAEVRELAPGALPEGPTVDAALERRLDLAFELIERGQVEAGLRRLEALHAERPGQVEVTRLLAQAHVRVASGLSARSNFSGAGQQLDRAAALYLEAFPECTPPACEPADLRTAHWNRIVAWLNARQPETAERALTDAAAQGFDFPELRRALDER